MCACSTGQNDCSVSAKVYLTGLSPNTVPQDIITNAKGGEFGEDKSKKALVDNILDHHR